MPFAEKNKNIVLEYINGWQDASNVSMRLVKD